jgi:hypothetical protein
VSDRYEPPNGNEPFDPYEGLMDLTGGEPLPPLEDPGLPPATPPRSPLLTGLILGLLLVVLSVAIFKLTRDDGAVAADATTTTTTSEGGAPGTTSGDTTGSTGTAAVTTTPTTSTTAANFPPYEASGTAVPVDQLVLKVDGIGPINLGSPAADAVGTLISSLGDPTSDTGPFTSNGEYGTCVNGTARVVKWGALAAIIVIDPDGTETFGGYRLDLTYDEAAVSDTAELETLSGLKLGDSVLTLRDIYQGFDVNLVDDPDLGLVFELHSGTTGNLLLWGPVLDSGNEGTDNITGIYSVDAAVDFC